MFFVDEKCREVGVVMVICLARTSRGRISWQKLAHFVANLGSTNCKSVLTAVALQFVLVEWTFCPRSRTSNLYDNITDDDILKFLLCIFCNFFCKFFLISFIYSFHRKNQTDRWANHQFTLSSRLRVAGIPNKVAINDYAYCARGHEVYI